MTRRSPGRLVAFALLSLVASTSLHAYALLGVSWPTGNIPLRLQLDATAPTNVTLPLMDGSASWNAVATAAVEDWNSGLSSYRSRFAPVITATRTARLGDLANNVLFSDTVYGSAFDSFTLAMTLVDSDDAVGIDTIQVREADLIINNTRRWNSYRGRISSDPLDLRRVIVHELGHVLGLDHPDAAVPAQSVSAIMNSTISNLESTQADDRSGGTYLYSTPLLVPRLTQQPTSQTATVSTATSLTIGINDGAPPTPAIALLTYNWYFKAAGASTYEKLFTLDTPTLDFGSVQQLDAGSYYVEVMTPDTRITSNAVTLTVNPIATSAATALANLSTRGIVPAASDTKTSAMIVGFVVTGSRDKQVLLRAIGPTLASFGVAGTLADPVLTLKNSAGVTIATSPTVWDSINGAQLRTAMAAVGAFGLPSGSRDAVLLASLSPGNYTAQTTSPAGVSGVVLVEAYDADTTPDPNSRLANLSTRGFTGTGANLLIAGFVVQGAGPHTYLIRLSGPTLHSYGVNDTVEDPLLKLFNNTSNLQIRQTDDWDSPLTAQPSLQAAFNKVGAFNLTDRMESAMLVTLQPGNYTAQATGNTNGGTTSPTGNTLIEIYEVP